ncbi:MAG: hypothetical protein ABIT69_02795 [Sphingomicrobium sp.]
MPPRINRLSKRGWALSGVALLVALPVLAQERPESILPPGFGEPAPPAQQVPGTSPAPTTAVPAPDRSPTESAVVSTNSLSPSDLADTSAPAVAQPEYPSSIRRDAEDAGVLNPADLGLGERPWGGASGKFLSILMRRMDTPLVSRWAHIALRNALLVKGAAPGDVDPADWAGERSWLLLRLGESNAARLLASSLDTENYTPKMTQVAAQVALANSDPAGLCALESRLGEVEARILPLVKAMCASMAGEAERAAADIESARRRGTIGGIDLSLADKVVGAGADTARAVTIEWEPVQRLNAWRYGLASATGMMPPARLISAASPPLRAWMAQASAYAPLQKLEVSRTAAALGVLSSDAYVDLYAAAFDATDPDDLGGSDAWKLRQAYVGKTLDSRLEAMRALWGMASGKGSDRLAAQVLTARAATLVTPDKALEGDAPDLIASMLSAGFDQAAARWAAAIPPMGNEAADKCWAMLALGAPSGRGIDLRIGRIEAFAGRDKSAGKKRTALLVAGLAGIGRIDAQTAGQLNQRYGLGLGGTTRWTELIDGAARRRQAGTATILAASGLQGREFAGVPALYQYHGITALHRVGLDFMARMVAAEALART